MPARDIELGVPHVGGPKFIQIRLAQPVITLDTNARICLH